MNTEEKIAEWLLRILVTGFCFLIILTGMTAFLLILIVCKIMILFLIGG